jgi:hypothetical protein
MRTNKLYEDRNLDLSKLWKSAGRKPPGRILTLPPESSPATGGVHRRKASRPLTARTSPTSSQ